MRFKNLIQSIPLVSACGFLLSSCAEVSVPDARNVDIPSPIKADKRKNAVNERPDSVMYLPLGEDVLVPTRVAGDELPHEKVGPFELRSETLAGALQLILADYDVSIAFETEQGLNRKVTVANLRGDLNNVVDRVCSLADLYCSYDDGTLVVKDRETFAVVLPPLANAEGGTEFITDTIQGLSAVLGTGSTPIADNTSRTIIYTATARTAKLAENYFQRLRANTAMIVFETYIWEVSLNAGNSTGIDYSLSESFDKFNTGFDIVGSVGADFTNPVSIGLPQTAGASPADLVEFLSQFGAVKTISQPQITVLSGSDAELRVADTQNYVSEVTSTISGDQTSTSVSTDSVDSGFTLSIGSSWDKSTIYANININLTNVSQIEDFTFSDSGANGTDTIIQLPQTTERELTTQIRMRPGDSVLIGGLVRETDNFNSTGPGFMEPVLPSSRTATTQNLELVVLLRPRVIVYTPEDDSRYLKFVESKTQQKIAKISDNSVTVSPEFLSSTAARPVVPSQPIKKRVVDTVVEPAPVASVAPVTVAPPASPVPSAPIVQKKQASVAPVPKPVPTPAPIKDAYVSKTVPKPANIKSNAPYTPIVPTISPTYKTNSAASSYSDVKNEAPKQVQVPEPIKNIEIPVTKAPEKVMAIDSKGTVSSAPLSPEVFNNAAPLDVYEAYEKSKNSYYSKAK